jgi:hypothetical protein
LQFRVEVATKWPVHLLFLVESGRLDQRALFALGGIALRDHDWRTLRTAWQETLSGGGWPLDREVKWHGIRRGDVPPPLGDAVFDVEDDGRRIVARARTQTPRTSANPPSIKAASQSRGGWLAAGRRMEPRRTMPLWRSAVGACCRRWRLCSECWPVIGTAAYRED